MKSDKIEIYATLETHKDELIVVWRWRYVRSNGSILAGPQESYTKRVHCVRMALLVTGWKTRMMAGETIRVIGPEGEDWTADADNI